MEPQQLTLKSKKKTGKIVIITLAVALVAALGFIVWQNFIYKAPVAEIDSSDKTTQSEPAKQDADTPALPDMIDYAAGIPVSAQADLAKLTNAPATFKAYLYGNIEKANQMAEMDGCTTVITVKKLYKQMYAVGGVNVVGEGCGGGFAALWGDTSGSWKQIAGSQAGSFGCADLMKYKVPAKIAGSTCIDDAYPEGRTYSQE